MHVCYRHLPLPSLDVRIENGCLRQTKIAIFCRDTEDNFRDNSEGRRGRDSRASHKISGSQTEREQCAVLANQRHWGLYLWTVQEGAILRFFLFSKLFLRSLNEKVFFCRFCKMSAERSSFWWCSFWGRCPICRRSPDANSYSTLLSNRPISTRLLMYAFS